MEKEMNMFDIYEESLDLLGRLSGYRYMAVDGTGELWAYKQKPELIGVSWSDGDGAIYIRNYKTVIVDWDKVVFDINGLVPVNTGTGEATGDDELFEEIKQHLEVARSKHPEFPEDKGFGLAAVTEEYLELTQAINDKKSCEERVGEALDTIVTLFRLIKVMRMDEQNKK